MFHVIKPSEIYTNTSTVSYKNWTIPAKPCLPLSNKNATIVTIAPALQSQHYKSFSKIGIVLQLLRWLFHYRKRVAYDIERSTDSSNVILHQTCANGAHHKSVNGLSVPQNYYCSHGATEKDMFMRVLQIGYLHQLLRCKRRCHSGQPRYWEAFAQASVLFISPESYSRVLRIRLSGTSKVAGQSSGQRKILFFYKDR